MTYKKYKITNNAETSIDGDISASASTLIVKENEGDLFPTEFPFLSTLEHFDTQGYVTKREIIEVTNRSGDNFTITRAVEPCVQDDTAGTKIQAQNALSFKSGDKISIYPAKGITEDIQNEVSRLETDKADDSEVLHKSGDETATGKKTFEELETTGNTTIGGDTQIDGDLNVDGVISGDGSGLTNIVSEVPATQSIFTAGEDLTAGNAVYVDGSDGKVYKTKADDTNKLGFIGFAKEDKLVDEEIKIQTAGVNSNQSSLTIGDDYYISDTAGEISDTPGTNKIKVGKAISGTSILIFHNFGIKGLGSRQSMSRGTNYTATTDGFCFGYIKNSNTDLYGYIGSTIVVRDNTARNDGYSSISWVVRKGDTYKWDSSSSPDSYKFYFTPLI